MSEKPFSLEYHWSTNSWSKFPIVGSNASFKPFGISFSAMQRAKKYLCDSYLVELSLRRLSFSRICSLFLLVAGVCCSEIVVWLTSSLTSVNVEACSRLLLFVFHVFFSKSCCLFLLLAWICCSRRLPIGCS